MQEQPEQVHGEVLQESQGCPDILGAGEELQEVEEVQEVEEEQEVEEVQEVQEEVEEVQHVSSGSKDHDGLQDGQKEDPNNNDVVKEKFLTAVVDDPTLPFNREDAAKIYDKMIKLEKELGLKLPPLDLKEQLSVEKVKEETEETEEKEEKDEKEEKEEKEREEDGPPSSSVAPWIEQMHEEWDSSEDSTVVPSWAASSQDLEEKLAHTAPEDYMNVAAMHEIKAEKKARREEKKEKAKNEKSEKAGSDGFIWSPLTKKGFNDFILYCQGGNPTVEPCMQLQQLPTPEAPKEKVIKWKPITKDGLRCFMAGFDRQVPDPFALVAEMAFGDFVEASIAADIGNLPEHIDPKIAKSIVYVHELYHLWGVYDFHDIEWWLQDGWGPLFVVSLLSPLCSLVKQNNMSYESY